MGKVTLRMPDELIAEVDELAGEDEWFTNRSDAIRYFTRAGVQRRWGGGE